MSQDNDQVITVDNNHPAITEIMALFSERKISRELCQSLIHKFNRLQRSYVESCSMEKILEKKALQCNKELKIQKAQIASSAEEQEDHRTQLNSLRQFIANIQAELDNTNDQLNLVRKNSEMKYKELSKLEDKLARARENNANRIETTRIALTKEIDQIQNVIIGKKQHINHLEQKSKDDLKKIDEAELRLTDLENSKKASQQSLIEISANPVKIRQNILSLESHHQSLLKEEIDTISNMQSIAVKLDKEDKTISEYNSDIDSLKNEIEVTRSQEINHRLSMDDLRRKISLNKESQSYYQNELISLKKNIKEEDHERVILLSRMESLDRDIVSKNKEIEKLTEVILKMKKEKGSLENQLKTANIDIDDEKKILIKFKEEYRGIEEKNLEALKALVACDSGNKTLVTQIKNLITERTGLQVQYEKLLVEEHEVLMQIKDFSISRDRKAREIALMKKKTLDIKGTAQEKNLKLLDLSRKAEVIEMKSNEYAALYDGVKTDRNRYIAAIQSSNQLIVELKEKIRIIQEEGNVLSKEYSKVESATRISKNEIDSAFSIRDVIKEELRRSEIEYRKLEEQLDFQATETSRMNKILERIEQEILNQQVQYSHKTADCIDRRRMYLDKTDAISILHEQLERHAEIMKKGEKALKERDDEIRMLVHQLKDFEHCIELMGKKLPEIRKLDNEINEIRFQIQRENSEVEQITKKLEVPEENGRARKYSGKDMSMSELEEKITVYEQRLSSKDQQLWETQILLREIGEKIEKVSKEIDKGRPRSAKVSEKCGYAKAEAMKLRRKKRAVISELAVWKAHQIDTAGQIESVKEELQLSSRRAANGEAFDEFADKMVKIHQSDLERQHSARRHKYSDDEEDNIPPGRQKFDAYPTSDGLSRPYGGFPVFQPQRPSGNLRHYKKETPREIKL